MRSGSRENVHVTYRMRDGREAQTIVTEAERDALQRTGALIRDHGSSRLLSSMDRWDNHPATGRPHYPPEGA